MGNSDQVTGDTDWLPDVAADPSAGAPRNDAARKIDLLHGYDTEDVGNAQRLIAVYGDRLRYCHAFCKWFVWEGRRWQVDETDIARSLAQDTMRKFAIQAIQANNEALTKFAASCRRSNRITNALREAEPHLAIRPADLDTHPDLVNFLNGTLNLKTGEFSAHSRELFITKLIQHDYQPEAQCPTFLSFLHQIMGDGPDASEPDRERCDRLVEYLQRAFGYSLTGRTGEKVVFLLHGFGDNGKSTLPSTFRKLLEEYAVLLQIDTLMVRPQESNNTQADLADLRGARYVMTSETEEGQRLSEGKLKRITQGMGKIKAVRKYENPFEFEESHKLWIDANHLPKVRGTDNAIWNRLHPVPFSVTIPKGRAGSRITLQAGG
jgi:putative DNA primase/helicase